VTRLVVKTILGFVLIRLSLYRLLLKNRAVIVLFHTVNPEISVGALNCAPSVFARLCRSFARHFFVISMGELLRRLASGEDISRCLVITFDDGYLDNYQHAAAILRQHDLPATFFVTTGFISSNRQAWWDMQLGLESKWMSWDQVRRLKREGFAIGGHTESHVDLGKVHGSQAEREIVGSYERIRRELGSPADTFSYPYGGKGQMSDANRECLKAAGYRCCLSAYGGSVSIGDDPFYLTRHPVSSEYRTLYDLGFDILRAAVLDILKSLLGKVLPRRTAGSSPLSPALPPKANRCTRAADDRRIAS
jgi:peptidoglycan/xylan/chitin deacetylase (PgdA/CDA1 family)